MDLILFDLDGTLINSARIILETQYITAREHGIAHPGERAGLDIVGLSLDTALARLFGPVIPAPVLSATYKRVFNELRGTPGYEEPPFAGVPALLADLKGWNGLHVGMATGKTRRGVDTVLDMHGWRDVFGTIQTADSAPSKPDPGMIHQGVAEAGSHVSRTVMVGDSVHDMAMAKAAGAAAIGVGWGFQPPALLEQAGADVIARQVGDLPGLIAAALRR